MTTRAKALLFLLALELVWAVNVRVHAQTPSGFNVQHDGAAQFCAPGLQVIGSTYNFVGTCSTPPPPQNQLTRASITYTGGNGTAANADLTQWATTWGRIRAADPPLPWPIARGATPQWTMARDKFTCTLFHTTTTTGSNVLAASSYNTASNFDVSIAHACGDFTSSMGAGCYKTAVNAFASSFLTYGPNNGTAYNCHTDPNSNYYLNLRWTNGAPIDPNPAHPLCTSSGCKIAVQSNTSPT